MSTCILGIHLDGTWVKAQLPSGNGIFPDIFPELAQWVYEKILLYFLLIVSAEQPPASVPAICTRRHGIHSLSMGRLHLLCVTGKMSAHSLEYTSLMSALPCCDISLVNVYDFAALSVNKILVKGSGSFWAASVALCLTSLHSVTLDLLQLLPVGETATGSFHCAHIFSIPSPYLSFSIRAQQQSRLQQSSKLMLPKVSDLPCPHSLHHRYLSPVP